MTATVLVLAATVVAVLFVAWTLGHALIRIDDHRAEQLPPVVPVEELPPARSVPDVERHIDWILPDDAEYLAARAAALAEEFEANLRAWEWATGELERIHVDLRDEVRV